MMMNSRLWFNIIFSLFFLTFLLPVRAADNVAVSANIPDTVPPIAPILIAPEDEQLINNSRPTFKWHESTDNLAISHYALYIDGKLKFDHIPLDDSDNSNYELLYNSLQGIYSLTIKSALSEAQHSWQVVAYDYGGNSNTSVTWIFTIDTLAPNFTINKIGDVTVNISSSNLSLVPSESIILFATDPNANEPIIIATGEANSRVQLTVTLPNTATGNFITDINNDGQYELQLGILPRDVDIRLDFMITDQVGHVSVLEDVYIRISLQYWPSNTPMSTISPSVSQSGGGTIPLSATASPSISLTPIPSGVIPIVPPREVIHQAALELTGLLPESIAQVMEKWFGSKAWETLSKMLTLYLLLFFYLLLSLIILSKFALSMTKHLLWQFFGLIWPFYQQHRPHLVFEYSETIASPLVKIELYQQQDNRNVLQAVRLSDRQGNFADFDWSSISDSKVSGYYLQVIDDNFYFPIGIDKPTWLGAQLFYQQEVLNKTSHQASWPLLIPTLRAKGQTHLPIAEQLRLFGLYLAGYPWWFLCLNIIMSLLFSLRFGGMANHIVTVFYLMIAMYHSLVSYRNLSRHHHQGDNITVVDEQRRKISDATLLCSLQGERIGASQAWLAPILAGRLDLPVGLPLALLAVFGRKYHPAALDMHLVEDGLEDKIPTLLLTRKD